MENFEIVSGYNFRILVMNKSAIFGINFSETIFGSLKSEIVLGHRCRISSRRDSLSWRMMILKLMLVISTNSTVKQFKNAAFIRHNDIRYFTENT